MARLGRAQPFPPILQGQKPIFVPPDDGVCWGHQTPDAGEDPVSWQLWQKSLGLPLGTSGDPAWGEGLVTNGTPIVGQVVDTLDPANKTFTVTPSKYGSPSGSVTISIRGDVALFNAFDASPSWDVYSGPIAHAWRFVQLRLEFA